jgi:hypothetical protein
MILFDDVIQIFPLTDSDGCFQFGVDGFQRDVALARRMQAGHDLTDTPDQAYARIQVDEESF